MNVLYLVLGALLLILAIVDLLWTTLWVDGSAGPVTARLTTLLWQGLQKLGGRRSRILSLAGPLILTVSLITWVTLLWVGWTFLFAGGDGALMDTNTQEPVTWAGRIYFVANALFTMGNGEFSPTSGFWQIATGLTTASGMLFVTLSVSYVLSVMSAVAQKRAFATGVTGLGLHSTALVAQGWNGEDFHALDLPLNALVSQLSLLADQHKTHPILHYYHSESSQAASSVAVAILDEALTMLLFAIPEECRPNPAVLASARSSTEGYLRTLNSAFIKPAQQPPAAPDLSHLRSQGIPVVDDAAFDQALTELGERRRKLLGMVRADTWAWSMVNE
jgi:hypothetical protein